ncbi:hypothetical protein EXN66_Car014302 [Channa argus]|uniref:MADF domain-containing protein n=1 Tax=Channa argus TaxID=215402 RepID=A0A6G1Q7T3_CHAAH|nr:hypothetical protein EXN66_Car014302 [Channa argus]KAK2896042.1 hypothetical protein Q8A73_015530 [Channa argus]
MTAFEERLCEEVRKYRHLYDTSVKDYRDHQMTNKSWREIAKTLCSDEHTVKKQWKYIRDRFVKAKRKSKGADGVNYNPAILESLSWLDTYVRHRGTERKYDFETTAKENGSPDFDEPTSITCPKADPPLPALLPQKSPILVPSTPELETSELDSDSSYVFEDSETVSSTKRQRRDNSMDILKRLSTIDRGREQMKQEQSTVEYHFCMTMAKMLSPLSPIAKNETMFNIHQLVYEAQKRYMFGATQDN